jgi:hypothetical protein
MALTTDDRFAIYKLMAPHGHLIDCGGFDRLDEVFTHDSSTTYKLLALARSRDGCRISRFSPERTSPALRAE